MIMNQLAYSRNRRKIVTKQTALVRTAGSSSKSWTPTLVMLGGAALGGVALYEGHLMTGTALLAGGLIGGSLLEGKDS